jgi:hypothetical protein
MKPCSNGVVEITSAAIVSDPRTAGRGRVNSRTVFQFALFDKQSGNSLTIMMVPPDRRPATPQRVSHSTGLRIVWQGVGRWPWPLPFCLCRETDPHSPLPMGY